MKKICLLTILTALFILTMSNLVFALTANDIPPGDDIPSDNITRVTHADGSLIGIAYYISSTGATSGIRYRTSAITVMVAGQIAVIDISSLGNKPSAGEQQYTLIEISKQDIINALLTGDNDQVEQALTDPEKIQIGAHIQIYNAATGQVLATITNEADVAPIASKIGFGSQDISDMESRWQDNNASVVYNPDDVNSSPYRKKDEGLGADGQPLQPGDRGYRLRPSVLVK